MNDDMQRILKLPILKALKPEEIEALSEEFISRDAFLGRCTCGNRTCTDADTGKPVPVRLLPDQAAAIRADRISRENGTGVFCAIRVGGGKSFFSIAAASEEFRRNPNARVLLILPPGLVKQFMQRDVPWAQAHSNTWIPRWIVLHEKERNLKLTLAGSGMPGVYILPFSQLSLEDGPELIQRIDADLVIVDEAHTFRGATDSGRQSLFWKWVKEKGPRGIAMSGSFNRSRLADFHRIAVWVLGRCVPMPRTTIYMQEWDATMNSKAEVRPSDDAARRLKPLVRWARQHFPRQMEDLSQTARTIRRAFKLRMRTAPGAVVSAKGGGIKTAITIENIEPGPPGAVLAGLINQLEEKATTPDGRVLLCGLESHQVMRQLTAGFWLKHTWITSHPKCELAIKEDALHTDYRNELSHFLKSPTARRLNLFIPTTVGNYHKNEGPIEGYEFLWKLWRAWKRCAAEITKEEIRACQRTEVIKVDDFKVEAAVTWARKHAKPGGIIWVYHEGLGDWIFERLLARKVRALRKNAGDDWQQDDGSEKYVCVASIPSHHVGRNLQHHTNQLIVQWCRSHDQTEQLIGRTHRTGQRADRLTIHTMSQLEFDHMSIDATLKDTVYDRQTFGGSRKLLLADWVPLPKEYPTDFLREKGFVLEADGSQQDEDYDG